MSTQIEIGSFCGTQRDDRSVVGYDYDRQAWVDTATYATRDPQFPAGSANNPLDHLVVD